MRNCRTRSRAPRRRSRPRSGGRGSSAGPSWRSRTGTSSSISPSAGWLGPFRPSRAVRPPRELGRRLDRRDEDPAAAASVADLELRGVAGRIARHRPRGGRRGAVAVRPAAGPNGPQSPARPAEQERRGVHRPWHQGREAVPAPMDRADGWIRALDPASTRRGPLPGVQVAADAGGRHVDPARRRVVRRVRVRPRRELLTELPASRRPFAAHERRGEDARRLPPADRRLRARRRTSPGTSVGRNAGPRRRVVPRKGRRAPRPFTGPRRR